MVGIIVSLIAFGIAVKNNPGVDIDDMIPENQKTSMIINVDDNKVLYA